MGKMAVCVGINDYPGSAYDLAGCVNDAGAWAGLLSGMFGFPRPDVRLILNGEATRKNILKALEGLVSRASAGDVRVFAYSGHGTWVPDIGVKDEPDGRDEALVPCDADFEKLIIDDDIRERLDRLAPGVSFTVISDSCHSGTVTRLMPGFRGGLGRRFYPPPPQYTAGLDNLSPLKMRLCGAGDLGMKEIFLSAASPDETAAEDEFDGVRRGVFSYFAIRELSRAGGVLTYSEWIERITGAVRAAGYPQSPQLEGPACLKQRRVFT